MRKVLALVLLIGCGGGGDSGDDDDIDAATPPDAAVEVPDAFLGTSCDTADGFTFYLNNQGGNWVMGNEDPTTNTSSIIEQNVTLAAWPHANWAEIVACMRQAMAEFNVQLVETEPVTGPYTEIVFTGTQPFQQGVISSAPGVCSPLASLTNFVMGGETGPDAADACHFAMFTVGAVTGLDFTTNSCDWMTFFGSCPTDLHWIASEEPCGDVSAHNCRCTNLATQNSHDIVLAAYGACPQP